MSPAPRPSPAFTTRPDTLFGATFLVLAPEHPLVSSLTTEDQRAAVEAYVAQASAKDLVSRKVGDKEKTGVALGSTAINPATGAAIPIWIADYVLMEYGTGAIMAVPGHDERDFDFATRYGLPIMRVVAGEGESAATPLTEAFVDVDSGRLVNSGEYDGLPALEGKRAITRWIEATGHGEGKVQFRLYDWCISRQRYWGPPIPIIYCDDCGPVPVPEDQLPVVLPQIEDFRPDDSGISPLARHAEWYFVPCPTCGKQGAPRDRRLRHLPRLGLVFPPLSQQRIRRPRLRSRAGPRAGCRSRATSAATSTPYSTCSTRGSSPWCSTMPGCLVSRSRSDPSARTA